MATKESFVGKFNISNETIEETADAYTESQAKFFMAQKIALKRGVIPQVVWEYFKNHPFCCEIRRCN
jgi:hypothetical protein